jgi:hypothetical protein
LGVLSLFPSLDSYAVCDYFSSTSYTAGSGWSADQKVAWWSETTDGKLDVKLNGYTMVTTAQHDFSPGRPFSIDCDISIVNTSSSTDRVGMYIYSESEIPFTIPNGNSEIETDGVLAYYYPYVAQLKFLCYDYKSDKWLVLQTGSIAGRVSKLGCSLTAGQVIFRVNGYDTDFKIQGDFSSLSSIDTLKLRAAGENLEAQFDNFCASPYQAQNNPPSGEALPLPDGRKTFVVSPGAAPLLDFDPARANPFGFGSAAAGGKQFSFTVGIPVLAAPVDIYVGIGIGTEIFLFAPDNTLHPANNGLVRWKSGSRGGIESQLLPEFDISAYPGTYRFYLLMAPANRVDRFCQWSATLKVAGPSLPAPGIMEQEIRKNLDQLFGLLANSTSDNFGALTAIFADKKVVTMTPAKLDLQKLNSGTPLTITADFGSGYRTKTGDIMKGRAEIVISNVKFSNTETGADLNATFHNITRNGVQLANGGLSGTLRLSGTGEEGSSSNITGNMTFSGLTLNGKSVSGSIRIVSGTMTNTEISDDEDQTDITMRVQFDNFVSGDYSISSGYVDIDSTTVGESTFDPRAGKIDISTNLQSGVGPVVLDLTMNVNSSSNSTLKTKSPGTIGSYTLSIDEVVWNKKRCSNYPIGGRLIFTKEGKTGIVTFDDSCDGSYGYSER